MPFYQTTHGNKIKNIFTGIADPIGYNPLCTLQCIKWTLLTQRLGNIHQYSNNFWRSAEECNTPVNCSVSFSISSLNKSCLLPTLWIGVAQISPIFIYIFWYAAIKFSSYCAITFIYYFLKNSLRIKNLYHCTTLV